MYFRLANIIPYNMYRRNIIGNVLPCEYKLVLPPTICHEKKKTKKKITPYYIFSDRYYTNRYYILL